MEERGACARLATEFFYGLVERNRAKRAVAREATGEVEARSDTPPEATSETNASPITLLQQQPSATRRPACLAPGEAVRLLLLHKRGTESYLSAVRGSRIMALDSVLRDSEAGQQIVIRTFSRSTSFLSLEG